MILSLIGFRQDQGTIFDVYEDICTAPDVLSNRSSSHNFQILWRVQSKKKKSHENPQQSSYQETSNILNLLPTIQIQTP